MVPLWEKRKGEVELAAYQRFYQETFRDPNPPLSVLPLSAEGMVSFKALLFIPSTARPEHPPEEEKRGLRLYCNGVLIMERAEALLPECLGFVEGVVELPGDALAAQSEAYNVEHPAFLALDRSA